MKKKNKEVKIEKLPEDFDDLVALKEKMNKDLKQIAKEIRGVIAKYQEIHNLIFEEENHTYSMDKMPKDALSVSGVLEKFYTPFDATTTGTFKKLNGNKQLEEELLAEWKQAGVIASYTGSRTHFYSEKYSLEFSGIKKEVRKPIFICSKNQEETSNYQIEAAKKFIHLMDERGAVLLDTEVVMGSIEEPYFGQPDTLWLMRNKQGEVGIVITDYKTNKKKNFETHWYTKKMLPPFEYLDDTALSHYKIQLPLYTKLFKSMLKGSPFEDIKFFGGVIIHLDEYDGLTEYKIPGEIFNKVMNMDIKKYL